MKKIILLALINSTLAFGQNTLSLSDLTDFSTKSNNWKTVGDINVNINATNSISTLQGSGILVCEHELGKYGIDYDLFSKFEHGDMDIEFEFMMAKGSNSGIYLQSRYEIQLFDSWGGKSAKYYDCGGIYQRWDDSKPENQKGYEGYAPRYNVTKAPGLWQKMAISFQAPRFDASGTKIENAKILFIKLNGVTIHENVVLSGVTRGSISETETSKAPMRIQGDHGSVAFRNIKINNFDKAPSTIKDINYNVYYGSYPLHTDLATLKPSERGKTNELTWEVSKNPNDYIIVLKGKYFAPNKGKYDFWLQSAGNSYLKIDGKTILENKWTVTSEQRNASIDLTEGDHSFEIYINKRDAWLKSGLGFWSAGPGFRQNPHHVFGSLLATGSGDPILVYANQNTLLRSFMDFNQNNNKRRIVHAISSGSPSGLHYTYDLDKGALFQVWRGGFLDASPMWNDRGDGSSLPLGSLTSLSDQLVIGRGSSSASDTTGSGYKPLGYDIDEEDLPIFKFLIYDAQVTDKIRVADNKYFKRELEFKNLKEGLFARLASSDKIDKIEENLFSVDDKKYFIQIITGDQVKIEDNILKASPVEGKIIYSILF